MKTSIAEATLTSAPDLSEMRGKFAVDEGGNWFQDLGTVDNVSGDCPSSVSVKVCVT